MSKLTLAQLLRSPSLSSHHNCFLYGWERSILGSVSLYICNALWGQGNIIPGVYGVLKAPAQSLLLYTGSFYFQLTAPGTWRCGYLQLTQGYNTLERRRTTVVPYLSHVCSSRHGRLTGLSWIPEASELDWAGEGGCVTPSSMPSHWHCLRSLSSTLLLGLFPPPPFISSHHPSFPPLLWPSSFSSLPFLLALIIDLTV